MDERYETSIDLVTVELEGLRPHPKNRNHHPKEQIERLAEIIKFQGFRNPVIVSNRSGYVVAGHGRIEAAKLAGLTKVPVMYQDFRDDDHEYAFSVSDNAIALWAELDLSAIHKDLPDIQLPSIDLLGIERFEFEKVEEEKEKKPVKKTECPGCGLSF